MATQIETPEIQALPLEVTPEVVPAPVVETTPEVVDPQQSPCSGDSLNMDLT
jgi:hypothetical protein